MFCEKCGSQIPDGTKFCNKCGAPVGTRAAEPAGAPGWKPSTTPELGGPARKIMTNRGLIKYLLFSILTLGIYSFYFVYKMAQDMNTMCEDDDQKTGGLIAFILFNFLTLGIYSIYWWYKIANRVYLNAPRYDIAVAEKGSTFLLWWLLGLLTFGIAALVGNHIVIKNVNSLAAAYNRTHGFV